MMGSPGPQALAPRPGSEPVGGYTFPPAPEGTSRVREALVVGSLVVIPIAAALAVAAYILGYL